MKKIDPYGLLELCVEDPEEPYDRDCGEAWPEPVEWPNRDRCMAKCFADAAFGTKLVEIGGEKAIDKLPANSEGAKTLNAAGKALLKRAFFVMTIIDAAQCSEKCDKAIAAEWCEYEKTDDYEWELIRLRYGD